MKSKREKITLGIDLIIYPRVFHYRSFMEFYIVRQLQNECL